MSVRTKFPLPLLGKVFAAGQTIPKSHWAKVPWAAQHRLLTSKAVECDFADGEMRPEQMSVHQRRGSSILSDVVLKRELAGVGIEVPEGTPQRILFLVFNVLLMGRDLVREAAKHHLMAVLPSWVPDDYRAMHEMSFTRPERVRLSGARQDVLQGMLPPDIAHTTQENVQAGSENIPESEQLRPEDPLLQYQMQTMGRVIPEGAARQMAKHIAQEEFAALKAEFEAEILARVAKADKGAPPAPPAPSAPPAPKADDKAVKADDDKAPKGK